MSINTRHPVKSGQSWTLYILSYLLFFGMTLPGVAQVGTWRSLPTLTEARDLITWGSKILVASDGGIVTFNIPDQTFENGLNGGQIRNLDVNCISLDSEGLLWVGSRSPGPVVEVLNPVSGEELDVEFVDLDEVTSFVQVGDSVYATFSNSLEGGLLLYRKEPSQIAYLDLFSNFPGGTSLDLSTADDVCHVAGKIIFKTTNHLLWAEQEGVNLKDPTNWHLVSIPGGNLSISRLIQDDGRVLVAADRYIYRYDFNSFTLIHTAAATIRDMRISETDGNQLYYASNSGLYLLTLGNVTADQLISKSGIVHIALRDNDIWMAHNQDFLGAFQEQHYSAYAANRPRDHFFNRLLVNDGGELVAGAYNGISIYNDRGWRSILPGSLNSSFYESDYDWNRMILDTLMYTGNAVVEDLIKDHSGNVYVALQGRGILKLSPDLPGGSAFYDAANDVMEPTFDSDQYILTSQMAVDGQNNVWTTTKFIRDGGHVITVFAETGEIYHLDQDDNGLNTRTAKSIAIDNNGLVWLGSQVESNDLLSPGGIHLIEPLGIQDGQLDFRVSSLLGSPPLASNEILQLEVDPSNTLWILTPSGVQSMQLPQTWKTSAELKNWASLYMTTKTSDNYYYWQLTDYNVTSMEIDPRGNHWFLSSNAGVHVFQANGRWINGGYGYNTSNSGLLNNEVYSMAFDAISGETYMSTPKGISILHTPFANPKADYASIHIYPQPFNPEIHERVIIQGLMDNSTVKILTVSGQMIRELNAESSAVQGFEAQWDGLDQSGGKVGSGVYILFLFNEDGGASSHKLAVLR